MKCSGCYTDNPPWQTVCSACGTPTLAIQLCPGGRILPPGAAKCLDCPAQWPEVDAYDGRPLLRGILRPEAGRIQAADGTRSLPFVELRDAEAPVSILIEEPGRARLLDREEEEAAFKIRVRPDGTQYCVAPGQQDATACSGLSYQPLPETRRIVASGMAFRIEVFEVPEWAESHR